MGDQRERVQRGGRLLIAAADGALFWLQHLQFAAGRRNGSLYRFDQMSGERFRRARHQDARPC